MLSLGFSQACQSGTKGVPFPVEFHGGPMAIAGEEVWVYPIDARYLNSVPSFKRSAVHFNGYFMKMAVAYIPFGHYVAVAL